MTFLKCKPDPVTPHLRYSFIPTPRWNKAQCSELGLQKNCSWPGRPLPLQSQSHVCLRPHTSCLNIINFRGSPVPPCLCSRPYDWNIPPSFWNPHTPVPLGALVCSSKEFQRQEDWLWWFKQHILLLPSFTLIVRFKTPQKCVKVSWSIFLSHLEQGCSK